MPDVQRWDCDRWDIYHNKDGNWIEYKDWLAQGKQLKTAQDLNKKYENRLHFIEKKRLHLLGKEEG